MKEYAMPYAILATVVIMLAACGTPSAKISGNFVGSDSETVKLAVVRSDGSQTIDSTVTDSKGKFKFNVDLSDGHERIANIMYRGSFITLLAAPGDHIKVNALACNIPNYSVQGSKESELLREINGMLYDGLMKLDSLWAQIRINSSTVEESKDALMKYVSELRKIKKQQLKFIETNCTTLAAVYALYQKLPNEQSFFNSEMDIYYSRLLSDSLQSTYPDSPYLRSLQKNVESAHNKENLFQMLDDSFKNPKGFPELNLPDIHGNEQSLSALSGNIIILDFWLAGNENNTLNNAEMKQLYNMYSDAGLVIYQVSLDSQKADWINMVQHQNLPWISVRDMKGFASESTVMYNISSLPANYVIGKNGSILAKNVFGNELENIIQKEIN